MTINAQNLTGLVSTRKKGKKNEQLDEKYSNK